jgi:hypothetical protein
MLVDVLLHGIAPIDTGTDLAEHLVPRAPNLCVQVAAIASPSFPRRGRSTITLYLSSRIDSSE